MIRWLRVPLPLLGAWALFVIAYVGFAVLYRTWHWYFGWELPKRGDKPTVGILFWGVGAYAAWRVLGFHPMVQPRYHRWLAATPWTSRQPLPLGPVHLVPQDLLLVGSALLLGWLDGVLVLPYLLQSFLFLYLALLGLCLFGTDEWPYGYAVAFGLGLMLYLWRSPPECLGVALGVYLVGYLGLRRSLAHFPWAAAGAELLKRWGIQFNVERGTSNHLGWPFGRLAPAAPRPYALLPLRQAVPVSALVGWWAFAGASLMGRDDRNVALGLALLLPGAGLPLGRVLEYVNGYAPPITLPGRLFTGRLIIPGYDQVFVAPLLAMAICCSLPFVSLRFSIDPLLLFPAGMALAMFILLAMGPSLDAWRLTGNHRIVVSSLRTGAVKVG